MIAFGSCNRQDKSQDYWEKIISLKPEWFLWIGDVVYAKKQTLKSLEEGLKLQNSHKQYQRLILNTRVDGVWDDHD
jgi:alkaline phosphatase D